jgi:hypothetical protein
MNEAAMFEEKRKHVLAALWELLKYQERLEQLSHGGGDDIDRPDEIDEHMSVIDILNTVAMELLQAEGVLRVPRTASSQDERKPVVLRGDGYVFCAPYTYRRDRRRATCPWRPLQVPRRHQSLKWREAYDIVLDFILDTTLFILMELDPSAYPRPIDYGLPDEQG